jgi:hypothetical protein
MSGLKGFSRVPRTADPRQRRNATRLSSDFTGVTGVLAVSADGEIELNFGTGLRNDGGTLKSKDGEIDHDSLLNFASDEHVAHSGVSISAGTGLSGGGDISASRTISLSAATTAVIGGVEMADARTDSGESAITLSSIADPADTPADADALRDDLVANTIADIRTVHGELETSIETLAAEFNDLLSKLRSAGILET